MSKSVYLVCYRKGLSGAASVTDEVNTDMAVVKHDAMSLTSRYV